MLLSFVVVEFWGWRSRTFLFQEWRRPWCGIPYQQGIPGWPGPPTPCPLQKLCCRIKFWSEGGALLPTAGRVCVHPCRACAGARAHCSPPQDHRRVWGDSDGGTACIWKDPGGLKYAKENPEKRYSILGAETVLNQMRMKGLEEPQMDPKSRDLLVQQASQCLSKLFQIASRTKKNFILDQCNVYSSGQWRKLLPFKTFSRKVVVVVPGKRGCSWGRKWREMMCLSL